MDTDARFWAKVEKQSSGCWNWTAYIDPAGYGRFHVAGEIRAHRWSYHRFIGPLDPDRVIDHTCRNRRCVNPQHLRLLTSRENNFAPGSVAPAKLRREADECSHGHPWTDSNTAWFVQDGARRRRCITCHRLAGARSNARRMEERSPACPIGHLKVTARDRKLYCSICHAASRRTGRKPRVDPIRFGCGHERATEGRINRTGGPYCGICRSEKRQRPDSFRARRDARRALRV